MGIAFDEEDSSMLDNGNGMMFSPAENWRGEIKRKTHMLNQKYNTLTEYQPEEAERYWKKFSEN